MRFPTSLFKAKIESSTIVRVVSGRPPARPFRSASQPISFTTDILCLPPGMHRGEWTDRRSVGRSVGRTDGRTVGLSVGRHGTYVPQS